MLQDFKKEDLESRMVVELRNGERYLVIRNEDNSIHLMHGDGHHWTDCDNMNEDCTFTEDEREYDIMTVYRKVFVFDDINKTTDILWERKELKEMTMGDIEKLVGCKVKIINGD